MKVLSAARLTKPTWRAVRITWRAVRIAARRASLSTSCSTRLSTRAAGGRRRATWV